MNGHGDEADGAFRPGMRRDFLAIIRAGRVSRLRWMSSRATSRAGRRTIGGVADAAPRHRASDSSFFRLFCSKYDNTSRK